MIIRYLEVAIVWCKLWSLGELSSEGVNKVGHQAGGRVVSLAAVHNAYIEQLDSSVYKIELYVILSYLL